MANDGTGTNWDENDPLGGSPERDGHVQIRDVRKGVRSRMAKEHTTFAGSGAGGEHKKGSAMGYWGDYSVAFPTLRPDGTTTLNANDAARIAFNYADPLGVRLKVHNGTTWQDIIVGGVVDGVVSYAKLDSALQVGITKEIYGPTATAPWTHRPGSAVAYYQTLTPSKRPDGTTNLDLNDVGRIWMNAAGMLLCGTNNAGSFAWTEILAGNVPDGRISLAKLDATLTAILGIRIHKGTYSGNGTTTKAVTGLGFQPDVVVIVNSSTGDFSIAIQALSSTVVFISGVGSPGANSFSFDADGFTLKTANAKVNGTGVGFGYFAFKANS